MLCGLALHMTAPANRHCPEPSTFLTHVLLSFCGAAAKEVDGDVPRRVVPGLLAPAAKGQSLSKVTPAQVRKRNDFCWQPVLMLAVLAEPGT